MKCIHYFLILVVITGLSITYPALGANDLIPATITQVHLNQEYSPDTILVQFHEDVYRTGSADQVHEPIRSKVIRDYSSQGMTGLELVSLTTNTSPEGALRYYRTLPSVRYAEPNYYRSFDIIPDDPDLWRQWGIINEGQVFKENFSPGLPGADIQARSAWNSTTDGSGAIIGVIDTGIDYNHPDLASNLWKDPGTGSYGYDTITATLDPMDLFGHGTHCAGIIGAVGNNSLGITGVNWKARIMGVSISGSLGSNTVADSITGILWASQHGARILSCSYGGPHFSMAEYDSIFRSGALVICSAGNSGEDLELHPHYPGSYNLSNIITVAATNQNDTLADFSCYGNQSVDLAAPGVQIYSLLRSVYDPTPLWKDPIITLDNWTVVGNWTINPDSNTTPLSGAYGTIDGKFENSSLPLTLSLSSPVNLSGIVEPVMSYEWQPVGMNYSYSVEMSNNGLIWKQVDSFEYNLIFLPAPIQRICKVPIEMHNGPLYIRFQANGSVCYQIIQNIRLSDGYGEPIRSRWEYMDGTSMSCPFVSGIAGLLASTFPDASKEEIRTSILSTIDKHASLREKTVTGGRANLTAALMYLGSIRPGVVLRPGWNQISFPEMLKNGFDTAGTVFAKIQNSSGHSVLSYNASGWNSVHEDEIIIPLISYWVFTEIPVTLYPSFEKDQNSSYSRDLTAGWNGLGKVGRNDSPAKDELQSINGSWVYLIGYNATSQRYGDPIIHGSGYSSDTQFMRPNQGYWLYVHENCTYKSMR